MTLLDSHSVERWLYMYADALRKRPLMSSAECPRNTVHMYGVWSISPVCRTPLGRRCEPLTHNVIDPLSR